MPSVFISWSGPTSKKVADILYNWLPVALQSIKPFMSSEDLKKGGRWQTDLTAELAKESFGVVALTPSNLTAPWILFEAGALSKSLGEGQVAPFLVGVKPSDLPQPLTQFNAVFAEKGDFKRLLRSINDRVPAESVDPARIDKAVDAFWPEIEKELRASEEPPPKTATVKAPPEHALVERFDSILQELLVLNRQQTQMLARSENSSSHPDRRMIRDLLDHIWRVIDLARERDGGLRPEFDILQSISSAVAAEAGLESPLRRRRRRPPDGTPTIRDVTPPDATSITFHSPSGVHRTDDLVSRASRIAPIRNVIENGQSVNITFQVPLSRTIQDQLELLASELAYDVTPF